MTKALAFLSRVLLCSLLIVATARAATMKLLTRETGWYLAGSRLTWTTDGGAHWKNITPTLSPGERVASVFFRNSQQGWVLLYNQGNGSSPPRQTLAITDNSGATWSLAQVSIPRLNPRSFLLAGGGYIYFLDSQHGWMNLSLVSSAAVRGAILVETQDGGKTWKWVDSPGRSGPIYFVDAAEGWLAGGPSSKLYVTRDGSETWHAVTVQPPPQAGRAIYPSYGLPSFQNGEDGLLPVTFSGPEGVQSLLVGFATIDGGRTWKPDAVVHGLYETSLGEPWPATVVDSTLVTGILPGHSLVLTRASHGSAVSVTATIPLRQAAVTELSFVDGMDGWILLGYHGQESSLYSTSDGGNAWKDITPHALRMSSVGVSLFASPASPTRSSSIVAGSPRSIRAAAFPVGPRQPAVLSRFSVECRPFE